MELHDDDKPIGRLLSRREALLLLGGAGGAMVFGINTLGKTPLNQVSALLSATPTTTPFPTPTCVVKPALTEGPYFVDTMLNRSDIRIEPSDESVKEGVLLRLIFRVSDVADNKCSPLSGAQVDVWHCDALGAYSGVSDPGFNNTTELWLRGYQLTDESGTASFTTIYPGWYSGRAVHIHFKIRTHPEAEQGYEFTSQLFFDEAMNEKIHAIAPYAAKGQRDTPNATDSIYQGSEGLLTLNLEAFTDEESGEEGYLALFDIGLDLTQTPVEAGMGGGGRPNNGADRPNGNPPNGNRPNGTPAPR